MPLKEHPLRWPFDGHPYAGLAETVWDDLQGLGWRCLLADDWEPGTAGIGFAPECSTALALTWYPPDQSLLQDAEGSLAGQQLHALDHLMTTALAQVLLTVGYRVRLEFPGGPAVPVVYVDGQVLQGALDV